MSIKKQFLFLPMLLSMILITDIIASQEFRISIASYWSDRILFWIWALSPPHFVIVFWKQPVTKIYLSVLLTGLILGIIMMKTPFWTIFLSSTGLERTHSQESMDGKYRIQIISGVMIRKKLQIIENKGIIEKVIVENNADFLRNNRLKIGYEYIREVKFIKETPDSLTLRVNTPWRSNLVSFKKLK